MASLLNFQMFRRPETARPAAGKTRNTIILGEYIIRHCLKRFAFLSSVAASFVLPGDVFGISVFSVGGDNTPASIQATVDLPGCPGKPQQWQRAWSACRWSPRNQLGRGRPPCYANSPGGHTVRRLPQQPRRAIHNLGSRVPSGATGRGLTNGGFRKSE